MWDSKVRSSLLAGALAKFIFNCSNVGFEGEIKPTSGSVGHIYIQLLNYGDSKVRSSLLAEALAEFTFSSSNVGFEGEIKPTSGSTGQIYIQLLIWVGIRR